MDGATPANARIAVEKGRTAAESRRSTRRLAGAHQAAARDAQHAGDHADPGRRADHGRRHLRRRASASPACSRTRTSRSPRRASRPSRLKVLDCRRRDRRAHRGPRRAAQRPGRRGLRAGARAEGSRRRAAAQRERHARVLRARRRRCAEGALLRSRRQGNPHVEHRRDLEAVRPRQGLGRALRLSRTSPSIGRICWRCWWRRSAASAIISASKCVGVHPGCGRGRARA